LFTCVLGLSSSHLGLNDISIALGIESLGITSAREAVHG